MSEISERYRKVSGRFTQVATAVPVTAWGDPSPCDGWVARDVLRHMVEWMPAFGPQVMVPADADEQARLVAFMGRQTLIDDAIEENLVSLSIWWEHVRVEGNEIRRAES